jgi:Tfp pilus assembly protein PilF
MMKAAEVAYRRALSVSESSAQVSPLIRLAALGLVNGLLSYSYSLGDNSLASDSIAQVIKLDLNEESVRIARILQAALQVKNDQGAKALKILTAISEGTSMPQVYDLKARAFDLQGESELADEQRKLIN